MNCDIVQGFHYSKPVDAETAGDYLAGRCPWNATPEDEARTSS